MFRFIKKAFFLAMAFFGCNALEFISVFKKVCKIRPQVVNINSDNPFFYPYNIEVNKCSGSCGDNIDDPYSKFCVLNVAKNINVKVFNLVSRTNKTRHIEWYETCKLKCNNKQRWNKDRCRCECKELIGKEIYDK